MADSRAGSAVPMDRWQPAGADDIASFATTEMLNEAMASYDRGDFAAALALLKPLAEQGFARAQGMVGVMYGLGQGVPVDYDLAWEWLCRGAEARDTNAEYNFGALYEKGLGTLAMPKEALYWFRRAAAKHASAAQFNIAAYYEEGRAVPQDFTLAYLWYHLAAIGTDDAEIQARAVRERRLMAAKLTKAEISRARRMARKWLAEHPKAGVASVPPIC